MAYQNLGFAPQDRPKPQVLKDVAYTFNFFAYVSGVLQTAFSSTGTITIRGPGGFQLATPVTDANVTNTAGTLSYALTAGNAITLGANYVADVKYYVSGVEYHGRFLFDVVRSQLANPVISADLIRHHPDLADVYFTADSATAQVYIEQAFEDVWQWIDSRGRRPYLVMSNEDMRRPIEHLALSRFFLPRVKATDDRWSVYMKYHLDKYDDWIKTVNLVYDEDQSGTADGTSEFDGGTGEEGRNFQYRYSV